jgi:uroporphyrinogen decarboxylase
MKDRDRFLKTMHFQSVDRPPYWVPVFWEETLEKWSKQSNRKITEESEEENFDCDKKLHIRLWLNFEPPFEEDVLSEDDEYMTVRTRKGIVQKELKSKLKDSQIAYPLEYPIKTREDYLRQRKRLIGNVEARIARSKNISNHRHGDYTVSVRGHLDCGFYGPLRDLVGFERLSYLVYDDPALVEMMMDDRADLILLMLDALFEVTTFDWFCFWEDMAYKNGPMISPALFRKLMMPRYKRITDFLHKHGVDIIFVDSDGDLSLLIPLWLESGINGMWPFEVQSGMDVVKLRKEYGKELLMIGGLDKRELAKDKKAIEDEILKKVPFLIEIGGYIPRPDHHIPPDVSYDNYQYFMEFLIRTLEKG